MIRGCKRVVTEALPSISRQTKCLLPSYNIQQLRSTVIVKRRNEPGLAKIGCKPKIRTRHLIYDFCERVHSKPLPPIQCILTVNILGLGVEGEMVSVSRKLFRNSLYPKKQAVYASPENLAAYETFEQEMTGKKRVTKYSMTTSARLKKLYLPVPMSGDNKWTLNQEHIRLALRKVGVEAQEDTITLLDSSISEPQQFQFEITVMGLEPITINGHIYHVYKDPTKNTATINLPPVWKVTEKKLKASDDDQLETEGSDSLASATSDSDSSSDDEGSPKLSKDVDSTEDENSVQSPEDPDKK